MPIRATSPLVTVSNVRLSRGFQGRRRGIRRLTFPLLEREGWTRIFSDYASAHEVGQDRGMLKIDIDIDGIACEYRQERIFAQKELTPSQKLQPCHEMQRSS